jgi:hypothetical protein
MAQSFFEPIIGQWYQDMQQRLFEVVAADEDSIEIQFYDGDVEELDLETWHQLNVTPAAEPSDASGLYDDLELDDIGSESEEQLAGDWQELLDKY